MQVAPREFTAWDWLAVTCGVLVLVLSFFDFYTHELRRDFGSTSRTTNAWTELRGSPGMVAVVLAVISSGWLFFGAFVRNDSSPVLRMKVEAGFTLALVAFAVAYVVLPHYSFGALDTFFSGSVRDGHGWAYWASVALTLLALLVTDRRRTHLATSAAPSRHRRHRA